MYVFLSVWKAMNTCLKPPTAKKRPHLHVHVYVCMYEFLFVLQDVLFEASNRKETLSLGINECVHT